MDVFAIRPLPFNKNILNLKLLYCLVSLSDHHELVDQTLARLNIDVQKGFIVPDSIN